jgi:hypothetical protein
VAVGDRMILDKWRKIFQANIAIFSAFGVVFVMILFIYIGKNGTGELSRIIWFIGWIVVLPICLFMAYKVLSSNPKDGDSHEK